MGSNNLYAGHGSLVKLPLLSSFQYCKASSTQLLFRTSVRRSKFLQVESFHINALPSSSNMFVLFTLLIIRLSSDGITKNQGPNFCQQSTNYPRNLTRFFSKAMCHILLHRLFQEGRFNRPAYSSSSAIFSCILHFYMFLKILFWYTDPEPNAGKNHRSPIFRYSKKININKKY